VRHGDWLNLGPKPAQLVEATGTVDGVAFAQRDFFALVCG
jgi:hypothetical protein